jgi:hypothetical protein
VGFVVGFDAGFGVDVDTDFGVDSTTADGVATFAELTDADELSLPPLTSDPPQLARENSNAKVSTTSDNLLFIYNHPPFR